MQELIDKIRAKADVTQAWPKAMEYCNRAGMSPDSAKYTDFMSGARYQHTKDMKIIDGLLEALLICDGIIEYECDMIHSEFCGSDEHHPVCTRPRVRFEKAKLIIKELAGE